MSVKQNPVNIFSIFINFFFLLTFFISFMKLYHSARGMSREQYFLVVKFGIKDPRGIASNRIKQQAGYITRLTASLKHSLSTFIALVAVKNCSLSSVIIVLGSELLVFSISLILFCRSLRDMQKKARSYNG